MPASSAPSDDLDAHKRSLLANDPSDFVAARNALARDLRARGDGAAAATIAKLRRPSVPVWALNCVARDTPDTVEVLADAAATARNAQARAAAGGNPPALREANTALRSAIDAVARAALAAVTASGRSADAYALEIDRAVADIAGSEPLLDELRRAVLMQVDASDADVFSQLAASVDVAATAARAAGRPPRKTDAAAKKRARLEARLAEDRESAAAARDALKAAEEALEDARQRYDRALRASQQADRAVERSRAALDRLDE